MTALVRPPAPVRARAALASVLTAILAAVLSATLMLPQPAALADPGEDDAPSIDTLRRKLDKATAAYNNAKGRRDASLRKEKKLSREIKELEGDVAQLSSKVGEMAAAVYKGSRANTLAALLESGSPRELAQGMTTVEYLAHRDYEQIKEYVETRDRLAVKRYEVELELRKQRSEAKKMAKRKKDAQKALVEAGGGAASSGPTAGSATADPAPRAPDGSWPPEACTQDDPTTDGCLTPRTRHAYEEAQRAGYKRHTSCHRQSSYGEHPKGRACDFAAFNGGFQNRDAYGDAKTYGDNLAGWFIGNADRLGVMYIIWYRRIWYPGQGWSSYNGGGSPSGDHTNHVHVSIQ